MSATLVTPIPTWAQPAASASAAASAGRVEQSEVVMASLSSKPVRWTGAAYQRSRAFVTYTTPRLTTEQSFGSLPNIRSVIPRDPVALNTAKPALDPAYLQKLQ